MHTYIETHFNEYIRETNTISLIYHNTSIYIYIYIYIYIHTYTHIYIYILTYTANFPLGLRFLDVYTGTFSNNSNK